MRALAAALLVAACGDDLARSGGDAGSPDGAQDASPDCLVPISHATIQAAVDDASCPTVWVAIGTYQENVVIARDVTVEGLAHGVIIDGGLRDSVLIITGGASVSLRSVGLVQGRAAEGGGIRNGDGTLRLFDSGVFDSYAFGETARGGGIYSEGPVLLERSSVGRNRAVADSGTAQAWGGGIYDLAAPITLDASYVGGNRAQAESRSSGSASAHGGGIVSRDIQLFGGSSVIDNLAEATSEGGLAEVTGGGIHCVSEPVPGAVSVREESRVSTNLARATGVGESQARGGGIDATGCGIVIVRSDLEENAVRADAGALASSAGGGIAWQGAGEQPVRLTETRVITNGASSSGAAGGGGIWLSATSDAAVIIERTTFYSNEAFSDSGAARGGAIELRTGLGSMSIAVVNSSLSFNAVGGNSAVGGALAASSDGGGPMGVEVASSTATRNVAEAGVGGGLYLDRATATVSGSIVWDNRAGDGAEVSCAGSEEDAYVTSGGFNLWGADVGCLVAGDTESDQSGVDPLLGDILDNGGRTPTHLPGAGSPAIDGGDPAGCAGPDDALLETDQRGLPRPVGVCDVGAVEVQRGRAR